jgi:hypothetical protein
MSAQELSTLRAKNGNSPSLTSRQQARGIPAKILIRCSALQRAEKLTLLPPLKTIEKVIYSRLAFTGQRQKGSSKAVRIVAGYIKAEYLIQQKSSLAERCGHKKTANPADILATIVDVKLSRYN